MQDKKGPERAYKKGPMCVFERHCVSGKKSIRRNSNFNTLWIVDVEGKINKIGKCMAL